MCRTWIQVPSTEITEGSLHRRISTKWRPYALPVLPLYPHLAYTYYIKYDDWLQSEEWTFLACVALGAGHALSFLVTRWSQGAKAFLTYSSVRGARMPR